VILSVTLPGYAQEVATPMTLDQSSLSELLDALKAGGDLDFMRRAMEVVLQALIDLEAAREIGAGRYERTESRRTYRNGNRDRLLSTKAGDVNLRILKLRQGSFFPSLLEPRRRIDKALWQAARSASASDPGKRRTTPPGDGRSSCSSIPRRSE